ncbi:MAG TPA: hypothetical protein ENM97_01475 [Moorella mulderi]|nr:hypothetical protein [Moorella mulderi]
MDQSCFLTTVQVCEMLNLTPRQVQRLSSEGYLEAREVANNRYGEVKLYDVEEVEALKERLPRILKQWANRDRFFWGRQEEGWQSYPQHWLKYQRHKERFLQSLEFLPERRAALLRAAFYLYHLNHYAKAGEAYLYELKERVLALWAREFGREDGLEIYFIQGEERVELCWQCRKKAWSQKMNYLEYARSTGGCPQCRRQKDYYSLYEFIVTGEGHRFCFHSPAPVARRWFKNREVPLKEGEEREGGYSWGRPITEREARAISLPEVVEELEEFLSSWDFRDHQGKNW